MHSTAQTLPHVLDTSEEQQLVEPAESQWGQVPGDRGAPSLKQHGLEQEGGVLCWYRVKKRYSHNQKLSQLPSAGQQLSGSKIPLSCDCSKAKSSIYLQRWLDLMFNCNMKWTVSAHRAREQLRNSSKSCSSHSSSVSLSSQLLSVFQRWCANVTHINELNMSKYVKSMTKLGLS